MLNLYYDRHQKYITFLYVNKKISFPSIESFKLSSSNYCHILGLLVSHIRVTCRRLFQGLESIVMALYSLQYILKLANKYWSPAFSWVRHQFSPEQSDRHWTAVKRQQQVQSDELWCVNNQKQRETREITE